jgi:hypothetical protein
VTCLLIQKPAASATAAPPHADQRLDQSPSAHPCPRSPRMLRVTRASTGPGGGPHRAQEPWRLGLPQQHAGPLLPLQCRQATPCARRALSSARWRAAAGCCWRRN